MVSKIQKWGNSLGLRIPKVFAQEINMRLGSRIEMKIENESLVIQPFKARKYKLEFLLAKIRPSNIPIVVDFGKPVGKEVF